MPDLERLHLRRPPGLASALDHAGDRIVNPHEGQRAAGRTATRKLFPLAADGRQVGPRAAAELEQHRLRAGQTHDVLHVVFHSLDETGGTLRIFVRVFRLTDRLGRRIPIPIALRTRHAVLVKQTDVEPDRAIERAVLMQTEPRQLPVKVVAVLGGVEVAVRQTPVGDRAGHPMDQLTDAPLTLLMVLRIAIEILAGHHVGRQLRPGRGNFTVRLLEQRFPRLVLDRGAPQLPSDRVEGAIRINRTERRLDLQPGSTRTPRIVKPLAGIFHAVGLDTIVGAGGEGNAGRDFGYGHGSQNSFGFILGSSPSRQRPP